MSTQRAEHLAASELGFPREHLVPPKLAAHLLAEYVPPRTSDTTYAELRAAEAQMRATLLSQPGGQAALAKLSEVQEREQKRLHRERRIMEIKLGIQAATAVAESQFDHPLLRARQGVWQPSDHVEAGGYWVGGGLSQAQDRKLAAARRAHVAKVRAAKSDLPYLFRMLDNIDADLAAEEAARARREEEMIADGRRANLAQFQAERQMIPEQALHAGREALGETPVEAQSPHAGRMALGSDGEILGSVIA